MNMPSCVVAYCGGVHMNMPYYVVDYCGRSILFEERFLVLSDCNYIRKTAPLASLLLIQI